MYAPETDLLEMEFGGQPEQRNNAVHMVLSLERGYSEYLAKLLDPHLESASPELSSS